MVTLAWQWRNAAAAAPEEAASDTPFYASTFPKTPSAIAMAALGRALFFDKSLSASGTLACASCHDPQHAFAAANAAAVQLGGKDGRQPGVRAAPSLTYTQSIPPFSAHYFDTDGDDGIDQGPVGGRTWDGRAQSAHDQARMPLFSPFEMANDSILSVVGKVQQASYAAEFRNTFGATVFADSALAFKAILMALETYQQTPAEFYPYSSKYDAWLRHRTTLSDVELRGLNAFNDPNKGNCARCHPSAMKGAALPSFTDYGFAAIGVPRNILIPANADAHYYDLGLCGPLRTDLHDHGEYCGMFRTPSLRNVATRRSFFHNGVLHRLTDVVRFYAERDTHPQNWYTKTSAGSVNKFDDLPAGYQDNIDREAPFDRHLGDKPALDAAEIDAIVAFLNTLTDGYTP